MTDKAEDARARFFRLIKNVLILGFVVNLFTFLRPDFVLLIDYVGLASSADLILNAILLIFVIYFGYFVLINAKYFLDLFSARFGHKDHRKLQNLTYDIAALISLFLASAIITPILTPIQAVGGTASRVVNIILLAVGFLIIYHLVNQTYLVLKQRFELIIHSKRQVRVDKEKVA